MQEKPFDLTAIVLLLILAILNDALIVFADLAFLIPIIGQITFVAMMAASFVIWGIIFFWFTMKLGFAGPIGLLQIGGGILAEIGLPVRTATVITGIFMANNPKAAKAGKLLAGAAAVVATGGAAAAVEGAAVAGGAAAEAGAAASVAAEGAVSGAGGAVSGAGAAARAGAGAAEGAAGEAGEVLTAGEKAAKAAREQEEVFGGETRAPIEQTGEELLGENPVEAPRPPEEAPGEEEATAPPRRTTVEKPEEEEGVGGKVIEAADRFRPQREGEEGNEAEAAAEQALEAQMGGAYEFTPEAQKKKELEEAGLGEEVGTSGKKSDKIEANGTMLNFRSGDEDLKKAA